MDPIFWPKEGTTGFPWPQIHWKNKREQKNNNTLLNDHFK